MRQTFRALSWLSTLDYILFALLLFFLVGVVFGSGMANIQTDAIDYYAIVQRLTGETDPIVPFLPFLEQRSPGYPLLTLPAYYALRFATFWITPETVRVIPLPPPETKMQGSERELLPQRPLRFSEIFFKNYDLAPDGSLFKWNIIAAMLITGYAFFFTGLIISGRTLAQIYHKPAGISLPPLIVVTSMVFMHNIVNTPAYATLTVFGISCLFTYFWVQGWQSRSVRTQVMAGLLGGLMVLTRLETVLIIIVVLGALVFYREIRFARNLLIGGLVPLALLLAYNTTQFGNPFQTAILKGDMNQMTFNASFVLAVLIRPQSSLLFWSTLISLGIAGLFFSPTRSLKILGVASLVLITLVTVRVPIMYSCVGQGTRMVSGLSITCPPDNSDMLSLIRFDANRYIIPLVPFAALGLRGLLEKLVTLFGKRVLLRG